MNRKEFYNTLSEDVKTKIKACKTEEEMMKVLDEEKIELDPELLDSISGGVFRCRRECPEQRCDSYYSCPDNCGCD